MKVVRIKTPSTQQELTDLQQQSPKGYISREEALKAKLQQIKDEKLNKIPIEQRLKITAFDQKTGALDNSLTQSKDDIDFTDQQCVENLDRWDNDQKAKKSDKDTNLDYLIMKKDAKEDYFIAPNLNKDIIEIILKDYDTKGNKEEEEYEVGKPSQNQNEQDQQGGEEVLKPSQKQQYQQQVLRDSKKQTLKSIETVQAEWNKKILNNVLLYKAAKSMKQEESSNDQRKNILNKQQKVLSNDTINNFKSLHNIFSQFSSQLIQHENLYDKIFETKRKHERVFDFTEEQKEINKQNYNYRNIEKVLLDKYYECYQEIQEKDKAEEMLRHNIFKNNSKIKNIQDQLKLLRRKFNQIEEKQSSPTVQIEKTYKLQRRIAVKDKPNMDEYMKIQKVRDEKLKEEQTLVAVLNSLKEENVLSHDKMESLDKENSDLRFKMEKLRLKLKDLYLKMLKNEDDHDSSDHSFIWIIKAMRRIHDEVAKEMFPSYIDEESIQFLLNYATLDWELDKITGKDDVIALFESKKNKKKNIQPQQQTQSAILPQNNQFKKRPQTVLDKNFKSMMTDVKHRLEDLKKGSIKVRKPLDQKDFKQKFLPGRKYDEEDLNYQQQQSLFQSDSPPGTITNQTEDRKIQDIIEQLKEMKQREINRIYKINIQKQINEKVLSQVYKIFICLFGQAEAVELLQKFLREHQNYENKIRCNKTFQFASIHSFTNNKNGQNPNNVNVLLKDLIYKSEQPRNTQHKYQDPKHQTNLSIPHQIPKIVQSTRNLNNYNFLNKGDLNLEKYNDYSSAINFKYETLYNYFPEFQNSSATSTFFKKQNNNNVQDKPYTEGTGFRKQLKNLLNTDDPYLIHEVNYGEDEVLSQARTTGAFHTKQQYS